MSRLCRLIAGALMTGLLVLTTTGAVRASSISAAPKPCPVAFGQTTCTSAITWDATDVPQGQIWRNTDGGPEGLFACGNFGTQNAPWIQAGHTYTFTLYQSVDCTAATKGAARAAVTVAGTVALPILTVAPNVSAVAGTGITIPVTAVGATSTHATGLPPGLNLVTFLGTNIQGTPTTAGTKVATIYADNSAGTVSQNVTFTITLPPPPAITSGAFPIGRVGTPFTYPITATNNPNNFNAAGLPAGLGVNTANGSITGTPSTPGTFSVTLFATNPGGTGQTVKSLTIQNIPPALTSPASASGIAGQFFSFLISATNSPISFGATGLPPGLTVNPGNGSISGVAQSNGIWMATISATNSAGTASGSLAISILPPPPVITGPFSAAGSVGIDVGLQMLATNPGNWSAFNLPPGLSINGINGFISGTPTSAGTFATTVKTTTTSGAAAVIVTITIKPPPLPPTANPQSVGVAYQTARAITLTGSDPTSLPLTFLVTANPSHGSLTGTGANQTYHPAPGFSGSDSFSFKSNNGYVDSVEATVTLHVAPQGAPTANSQSVAAAFQTAKAITLTASDPNSVALTYSITANPAHGALSGAAPNLTYTPSNLYAGTDSFTFKVNNGTLDSLEAAVSITIANPPAPTANPQSVAAAFQTAKAITLTASDPTNLALTYSITTTPAHGVLSGSGPNLIYLPANGFAGPDSFSFKVHNGFLDSAPATVSLTIGNPSAPSANPQSLSTAFQTPRGVTFTGNDPNGLPLTFLVTGNPAHGSLTGTGANRTYTPATGFTGLDSFTFKVNNGFVDSTLASVTIIVGSPSAPIAVTQSVSTAFNTPKTLTLTGSDPNNFPLTYSITANPVHGSLAGLGANRTYTPANGYAGSDSFSFKVNNGTTDSAPATITITVGGPSAPIANAQSVSTAYNTPKTVTLTGSDPSNFSLIYIITGNPAHGTLAGTGANQTYTPASGFSGSDSFSFKVNNGFLDSASAAVTFTVQSGPAGAQLAIDTFSSSAGGHIQVPVHFTPGPVGIANLQFDLTLPTGIEDVYATIGPGATAAGKTLSTNLTGQRYRVQILGLNTTTLPEGDIVDIFLHLKESASGTQLLPLSNVAATDSDTHSVPISASGGSITLFGGFSLTTPALAVSGAISVRGAISAAYPAGGLVTFEWSIAPRADSAAVMAVPATASAGLALVQKTTGPLLELSPLALAPGRYTVTVTAIDDQGNRSIPAQADVVLYASAGGAAHIYPNPWRADRPTSGITFDSITPMSTVKIFTLSGRWIRTLSAPAGSALWDLKNDAGDTAASGLYFYLITDNQGEKIHGELAIIK